MTDMSMGYLDGTASLYVLCNSTTEINHSAVEVVLGLWLECKYTAPLTNADTLYLWA